MKRIISMVLAVLLPMVSAQASGDILSGMNDKALLQLADAITAELQSRETAAAIDEPAEKSESFSTKYEGEGWATPEEAVLVYLDGLKAGDFSKMVSAFAIETYVDNYDLRAMIERTQAYVVTMEIRLPNANELLINANIETRRNYLVNHMAFQMIALSYPGFDSYQPITMNNYTGGIDAFMDFLSNGSLSLSSSFERVEFLDPSSLAEAYLSDLNQENLKKLMNIYGADELKSVAAKLSINSQGYLLCVDALRYGEKWYLCSLGGNIGAILGLSALGGGMAPFPIER